MNLDRVQRIIKRLMPGWASFTGRKSKRALLEEAVETMQSMRSELSRLAESEERIRRSLGQHFEQVALNEFRQAEALAALNRWFGGSNILPPSRGWALSPDAAIYVVNQLELLRPKCVLDLGTGLSTCIFAKYAAKYGDVRVVGVDHNEHYLTETSRALRGIESASVTLVNAPLVECPSISGPFKDWYDASKFKHHGPFDFVMVDGPPEGLGNSSRGNLMLVLSDVLAPGSSIILDDAKRPGERAVIADWVSNHGCELIASPNAFEKGVAHLRASRVPRDN